MDLLTETRTKVLFFTTKTIISGPYANLEDNMKRFNSLKLKSYLEENVSDFCAYYFRCEISDNIHHEQNKHKVFVVYLFK